VRMDVVIGRAGRVGGGEVVRLSIVIVWASWRRAVSNPNPGTE
jgi:hypothetical protein